MATPTPTSTPARFTSQPLSASLPLSASAPAPESSPALAGTPVRRRKSRFSTKTPPPPPPPPPPPRATAATAAAPTPLQERMLTELRARGVAEELRKAAEACLAPEVREPKDAVRAEVEAILDDIYGADGDVVDTQAAFQMVRGRVEKGRAFRKRRESLREEIVKGGLVEKLIVPKVLAIRKRMEGGDGVRGESSGGVVPLSNVAGKASSTPQNIGGIGGGSQKQIELRARDDHGRGGASGSGAAPSVPSAQKRTPLLPPSVSQRSLAAVSSEKLKGSAEGRAIDKKRESSAKTPTSSAQSAIATGTTGPSIDSFLKRIQKPASKQVPRVASRMSSGTRQQQPTATPPVASKSVKPPAAVPASGRPDGADTSTHTRTPASLELRSSTPDASVDAVPRRRKKEVLREKVVVSESPLSAEHELKEAGTVQGAEQEPSSGASLEACQLEVGSIEKVSKERNSRANSGKVDVSVESDGQAVPLPSKATVSMKHSVSDDASAKDSTSIDSGKRGTEAARVSPARPERIQEPMGLVSAEESEPEPVRRRSRSRVGRGVSRREATITRSPPDETGARARRIQEDKVNASPAIADDGEPHHEAKLSTRDDSYSADDRSVGMGIETNASNTPPRKRKRRHAVGISSRSRRVASTRGANSPGRVNDELPVCRGEDEAQRAGEEGEQRAGEDVQRAEEDEQRAREDAEQRALEVRRKNSSRRDSGTDNLLPAAQEEEEIDTEGLDRVRALIEEIMAMPEAAAFLEPVNSKSPGCESYYAEIKHPIDLGTISSSLSAHRISRRGRNSKKRYRQVVQVLADVDLVWRNCFQFNNKGDDVYLDAETCRSRFRAMLAEAACSPSEGRRSRGEKAVRKSRRSTHGVPPKHRIDDISAEDVPARPVKRKLEVVSASGRESGGSKRRNKTQSGPITKPAGASPDLPVGPNLVGRTLAVFTLDVPGLSALVKTGEERIRFYKCVVESYNERRGSYTLLWDCTKKRTPRMRIVDTAALQLELGTGLEEDLHLFRVIP